MKYNSSSYTNEELDEMEALALEYSNQNEIEDLEEYYKLYAPKELLQKMEYRKNYRAEMRAQGIIID